MKFKGEQITAPRTDVRLMAALAAWSFVFGLMTMPSPFGYFMVAAGAINSHTAWHLRRQLQWCH